MGKVDQKSVFLESEGDAWYERNRRGLAEVDFSRDAVVVKVQAIAKGLGERHALAVLEVGAGSADRFEYLRSCTGIGSIQGIEPSQLAVNSALSKGLDVVRGTADDLPFDDQKFDIVIFGFCLYLCDRDDLFKIASEANRVLKKRGWIIIHDFYSPSPMSRPYSHKSGVVSYKMDYRSLFAWHPDYVCVSHEVTAHRTQDYTDDRQEWVATSVLRRYTIDA